MRDADFLDLLAERVLDLGGEVLEGLGFLRLFLFFGFVCQLSQIEVAFGHGLQFFAFELGQVRGHPFVHAVRQQEYFDPLGAENLQMRAVFGGGKAVGGDEIDLVLAIFHAADVIRQRYGLYLAVGVGGGETNEFGETFLVGEIFAHAFFHHAAKFGPEGGVFLRLVAGKVFQHAQHLLHRTAANRFDVLALLQNFARHIERQVVGINHAAHKAQVGGHQLLGVVHDEYAPHVELDAMALLTVIQVKRGACRDVQQLGVFLLALDAGVNVGQRCFEIVRHVFVECLVLLRRDLTLGARPQRRCLIDRFGFVLHHGFALVGVPFFFLHQNRQGDVVGVFTDDFLQAVTRQQRVFVLAQVQDDIGAAPGLRHGFQRVIAFACRFPLHAMLGAQPGTAGN